MSGKLENAIRKLMLSVSDRIERERIDHSNAEREMDAEERAEEARIRAAWKKDPNNKDGSSPPPFGGDRGPDSARHSGGSKNRIVRRSIRETTDFEVPFFDDDEDEAQHERSFIDLKKMQKSMFEKQRQELVRMRQTSFKIGSAVLMRYYQRAVAQQMLPDSSGTLIKKATDSPFVASGETVEKSTEETKKQPSSVLQELERSDRGQIKFSFKPREKKKGNRKRPAPFDF